MNGFKPENIRIEPEAAFHLLRHINEPDKSFLSELESLGYAQDQISAELALPGSRFHPEFIASPDDLLLRIGQVQLEINTGITGNLELSGTCDSVNFPRGAGQLSVMKLSGLTPAERLKLEWRETRGFRVLHLITGALPHTNYFSVILKPELNLYHLITAFPGNPAMPMPASWMNNDMRTHCENYWNSMVFISSH